MTHRNTWPEKQEEIARFMEENPSAGEVTVDQIPKLEWCKQHLEKAYQKTPIIIGESNPNFGYFRYAGERSAWLEAEVNGEVRRYRNQNYLVVNIKRVKGHDKMDSFIVIDLSLYVSRDPDAALDYLLKEF